MRADARAPWAPFRARQRFTTDPPGFAWIAWMRFGMMVLRIHDGYHAGHGVSEARFFGLVPVGKKQAGSEAAWASLIRFLAESAWLPTALLPRTGLTWTAIDAGSARVTLTDGTLTVGLDIRFGDRGEISESRALRYREDRGRWYSRPGARGTSTIAVSRG